MRLFGNFSTTIAKACVLGVTLSQLAGCGDWFEPSVAEICNKNSEMCTDLNPDNWCRAEKAEIIKHRYRYEGDDAPDATYRMMLLWETYETCIVKASGIRHIKYREKEGGRMKGVLTAQRELHKLALATRQSTYPLLAYYQWSRFGHKDALKLFLNAANSGKLNTPEELIALASIQYKQDYQRTQNTLFKALSLYQDSDDIDKEIFTSLTTVNIDKENYKMAYVWSAVANHFDSSVDEQTQVYLANKYALPVDLLDELAADIVSALESEDFDAKQLGIDRL